MVYIVKYTENSDAACKSETRLFGNLKAAREQVQHDYETSLNIFGRDRFVLAEDENDPDKPWANIGNTGAHIQDGIDSYDWEIIEDERFCPVDEQSKQTMYALVGCEKNGENGNLEPLKTRLFSNLGKAKKELRKKYLVLLKEHRLENNAACDANGESIAGGYIETDGMEATLYDNTEAAFGALEEVAFLAIHEVKNPSSLA